MNEDYVALEKVTVTYGRNTEHSIHALDETNLRIGLGFAPALVMLGELSPGAAMKASFHGCLQNVIPFLVYGAVGIVLAVIATIPFGLGWFVLGPVAIASVYASYCDIFEDKSAS